MELPSPHAVPRAGGAHIAEEDALGLGDVLLDACISLNSHLHTSRTAGAPANGLTRPGLLWGAFRSRGASQVHAISSGYLHIQSRNTQSSRTNVIESRWKEQWQNSKGGASPLMAMLPAGYLLS